MKDFLRKFKIPIIVILTFVIVIFCFLLFLDASNAPSAWGWEKISFDWLNTFADLMIGIATISLTIYAFCQTERISKRQDILDKDELVSNNFYRITFIEKFQRLELNPEKPNLKLKIRETDKNLFKKISIKEDVVFQRLFANDEDKNTSISVQVSHDEYEIEHTDCGMDKEWKKDDGNVNMDAFAYIRFKLVKPDEINLDFFEKGSYYKVDFTIDAIDLFNVRTKCRLSAWFVVTKKNENVIQFKVEHNFGYYDSVEYIGNNRCG